MGKNQQHKAMQQQRHSANADGEAVPDAGDGTVDVSFHSPEWHAARIAALTTERVSWEDFKKKQKAEASMAAAEAENEEDAMRKYRAQLDADRAARLKGTNHADMAAADGSKKRKREDKDKDKKRSKDKKRGKDKKRSKEKKSKKKRRNSSDDSSSGSDSQASQPKKRSSPVRLSEFLAGK